ncbi:MAG: hypothetical protein AAGI30_13535 [Planctomycetota bacterium]
MRLLSHISMALVGACLAGAATGQAFPTLVASVGDADVAFDAAVLHDVRGGEVVRVGLPGGDDVTAARQSVRVLGPDRVSWVGEVGHGGRAAFATHGDAVTGFVHRPGEALVRVRGTVSGGVRVWVENDGDVSHSCGVCADPVAPVAVDEGDVPPGLTSTTSTSSSFTVGCDLGPTTDILVVYTPAAREDIGGTSAMLAEIDLAIANSNQSYADSGVNAELRLVGAEEVSYAESGNSILAHLNLLSTDGDGVLDDALVRRDVLAADLLALVVTEDGRPTAGRANFPSGFTSVSEILSLNPITFTHEIGHNRACSHEFADAEAFRVFDFASALRFTAGGQLRDTIMYSRFSSQSILRFTNPDVDFLGVPTGIDGVSDNARVIETTLESINQYRCAIDTCSIGYDLGSTANNGFLGFFGTIDTVWVNQFNVQPGADEIIQIRVGFGRLASPVTATVGIWDDLDNDGDPRDNAPLIASFNPVIGDDRESVIINIPATLVGSVGDSFFVGAAATQPTGDIISGTTNLPSNGRSWLGIGADLSNLNTVSNLNSVSNAWSIAARGVSGVGVDCNTNGFPDACDIADGASLDTNDNGVPDECETVCPADRDGDQDGDADDIIDFLSNLAAGDASADVALPAGTDAFDLAAYAQTLSGCE